MCHFPELSAVQVVFGSNLGRMAHFPELRNEHNLHGAKLGKMKHPRENFFVPAAIRPIFAGTAGPRQGASMVPMGLRFAAGTDEFSLGPFFPPSWKIFENFRASNVDNFFIPGPNGTPFAPRSDLAGGYNRCPRRGPFGPGFPEF